VHGQVRRSCRTRHTPRGRLRAIEDLNSGPRFGSWRSGKQHHSVVYCVFDRGSISEGEPDQTAGVSGARLALVLACGIVVLRMAALTTRQCGGIHAG
jgi:hypothetical protein